MWKKVLMFALTSGLAASAWKALEQRWSRQREQRGRHAEREQIREWENEGGALLPGTPATPQKADAPPR